MHHLLHTLLRCLLALTLVAMVGQARADAPAPLLLDSADGEVDAWPAVRLLSDPGGALQLEAVRQQLDRFTPPAGPHANLGPRRDVVWLHLPLQATGGDGRWVLDIAYPVLNQADVYLLRGGEVVQQARLGALLPFAQRPLPSRTHTLGLALAPGERHDLLLRVRTESAMVLPISLRQPQVQQALEGRQLVVQGLMMGVALALLAYSLAHWLSLRDPLFLMYALMVLGTSTFLVDFTGLGQQLLWSERTGLLAKISPMSVLLALAAGSRFVALSLQTQQHSPRVHRGLILVGNLAALGLALSLVGVLDYRGSQLVAVVLGPMAPMLAIPAAWQLARQGHRAARYMLVGWCTYTLGAVNMACVLRGWLPANGWTLHFFQWTSLVEMLVWLRVLGLHIEAVRRHAERTELERAALVSLAHTDALTGLPNRRGLQQALQAALPSCTGGRALAVFLLDLDGFKPVNDRLGHDAGDDLLVQVGQRLRAQVRGGDVVARLGGDEFVIMAPGIPGEAEALVLGRKLLDAFNQPFEVSGQVCRVGLTIGFALAPHDGIHADDLLKRADAAMYAGKQAGRHTVRRGGASPGLTFSS
ncbi:diguanylate cyclase [Pseudaquabacterium pictum]|uniref:GGDEF domain-containing protein n=1 Tax=Pseudaquabacterium pictum TaxID=2315236 RepID=A0A480AZL0_9BURK|nr:diguanylate cyclase [Rubrivivax pictus]GCL65732.1 hypothetical protein AQPW35_48130 [Rubrivivax pictus]